MTATNNMDPLIVTAYWECDRSNRDSYLSRFYTLAQLDLPILCFAKDSVCTAVEDETLRSSYFQEVVPMSWLPLPQREFVKLPDTRLKSKDTAEYMAVQNSKPMWLAAAHAMYPRVKTLLWMDFGVAKHLGAQSPEIIRDWYQAVKNVEVITMPAGSSPKLRGQTEVLTDQRMLEYIYWRFLGSVVACPSNLISTFVEYTKHAYLRLLVAGAATWEVCHWANFEALYPHLIHGYPADHNSRLFTGYTAPIVLVSQ